MSVRFSKFGPVAAAAIDRVRDISGEEALRELPLEARQRVVDEIDFHSETLRKAFDFRRRCGPTLGQADSDEYFSEKLVGMIDFAKMAVDPARRQSYSLEQVIDNVNHYSYLVSNLVGAPWSSRARKPSTEKVLKRASLDHSDVLKRLADR